eukprot:CAMPEP_0172651684 /NCGR_PEP_ID=MMETSP1068-20121228/242935_1 /TAXON_ID=35684 /ORGANISM="Pseudopedinella elastica, Strain CCMP716" /LENGTH=174 /DNA_ID=CAMNT_0013466087 /DNA_START=1372 /DNA_END=1897 /DNA_ORIENTATION=+
MASSAHLNAELASTARAELQTCGTSRTTRRHIAESCSCPSAIFAAAAMPFSSIKPHFRNEETGKRQGGDLSRGAAFSITLPLQSLNTEPDRVRTWISPRAQTRLVATFVGVGGALWRKNHREGKAYYKNTEVVGPYQEGAATEFVSVKRARFSRLDPCMKPCRGRIYNAMERSG